MAQQITYYAYFNKYIIPHFCANLKTICTFYFTKKMVFVAFLENINFAHENSDKILLYVRKNWRAFLSKRGAKRSVKGAKYIKM